MLKAIIQWLTELFAALTKGQEKAQPEVIEKPETPWLTWFEERKGWTEFSHDKELSKGWKLTKWCKGYLSVIGKTRAWCGMSLATALHANSYLIPEQNETASMWIQYGTHIDWKKGIPKGAIVVIQHPSGSYHVACASKDHPAGFKVLSLIGGNQENAIKVKEYDPTEDKIKAVRWPIKRVVNDKSSDAVMMPI